MHSVVTLLRGFADGISDPGINATVLGNFSQIFGVNRSASALFSSFVRLPSYSNPWDEHTGQEKLTLPWSDELERYFGVSSNITWAQNTTTFFNYAANAHSSSWGNDHSKTESTNAKATDCVLATAQRYPCDKFLPFLRSLRASGSCSRVVLFRSAAIPLPCTEVVQGCGSVEFVTTSRYDNTLNTDVARYVMALDYLTSAPGTSCTHVIFSDFVDMFWQRDPFALKSFGENAVLLSEEGCKNNVRVTIGSTGCNKNWIDTVCIQLLGHQCSGAVANMPVINSGLLFGGAASMIRLLHIFSFVLSRTNLGWYHGCFKTSIAGQGILNFIYYMGLWRGLVDLVVIPAPLSFFAHTVFSPPSLLNASASYHPVSNPLVNAQGVPLAIIHQYNHLHTSRSMGPWLDKFLDSLKPNCLPFEICTLDASRYAIALVNPSNGEDLSNKAALSYLMNRSTPLSHLLKVDTSDPLEPQFLYFVNGLLHRMDNTSFIDCHPAFDLRSLIHARLYMGAEMIGLGAPVLDMCSRPYPARLHNSKVVWLISNGSRSAIRNGQDLANKGFSFSDVVVVQDWLLLK